MRITLYNCTSLSSLPDIPQRKGRKVIIKDSYDKNNIYDMYHLFHNFKNAFENTIELYTENINQINE